MLLLLRRAYFELFSKRIEEGHSNDGENVSTELYAKGICLG